MWQFLHSVSSHRLFQPLSNKGYPAPDTVDLVEESEVPFPPPPEDLQLATDQQRHEDGEEGEEENRPVKLRYLELKK